MTLRKFLRSPRLFSYLGFLLLLLGLVCLPARTPVLVQPETPETELLQLGPIIAILVGSWSLPCFLLGAVESSLSKKQFLSASMLVLCLAYAILALSMWDAVRFWRGMLLQWLFSYASLLAPCVLANTIGLVYFTDKPKLREILRNPRARALVAVALASVPLVLAGGTMWLWTRYSAR